jgi:hypothetical protein
MKPLLPPLSSSSQWLPHLIPTPTPLLPVPPLSPFTRPTGVSCANVSHAARLRHCSVHARNRAIPPSASAISEPGHRPEPPWLLCYKTQPPGPILCALQQPSVTYFAAVRDLRCRRSPSLVSFSSPNPDTDVIAISRSNPCSLLPQRHQGGSAPFVCRPVRARVLLTGPVPLTAGGR